MAFNYFRKIYLSLHGRQIVCVKSTIMSTWEEDANSMNIQKTWTCAQLYLSSIFSLHTSMERNLDQNLWENYSKTTSKTHTLVDCEYLNSGWLEIAINNTMSPYMTFDLEWWPWPFNTQNVQLHEIQMHAKYQVAIFNIAQVFIK